MPPSIKVVARQGGAGSARQEWIRAAATALNRRPDQSARSLRRGRTEAPRPPIAARGARFVMEPFVDEVTTGVGESGAT